MAAVRINNYKKKRQRRVRTLKVLALFAVLAIAVLVIGIYTYVTREATLTISVVQAEMLKGEAIPAFSVDVEIEGSEKASSLSVSWMESRLVLIPCSLLRMDLYKSLKWSDGEMENSL